MDYLKQNHLSILIIAFLVVSIIFNGRSDGSLGATIPASVSTFTNPISFRGGTLYGYTNSTSTTVTSYTLVQRDIDKYSTIILTPNTGNLTITLPASSTVPTWLPTAGDTQKTCIVNGTTTAAIYITVAGGTGTTLLAASSSVTALGSLVIGPQKEGCFNFVRGNSTATTFDILSAFTTYQ